MFPSSYREILSTSLSSVLKTDTNIKSSMLLKAYATFIAIKENGLSDYVASYNEIFTSTPKRYFLSLLKNNIFKTSSTAYSEILNQFTSLSPSEFFRFIIPDLISNPIKSLKLLHEKFSDDILLFSHHIIRIHTVVYLSHTNSEIHKASSDYIWQTYLQNETITEIKLNETDFWELYNALFLYHLDTDELKLNSLSSEIKKLNTAIDNGSFSFYHS